MGILLADSYGIFGVMSRLIHRLFVYGTLRSDYHHNAHSFIARYFTMMGKARVRGKLYDGGEYPAGVPDEKHFIAGELYQIRDDSEFSQALQVLDEYEGSYDEPGEPALFRRELVDVEYNGSKVEAWIYWYNRSVAGQNWIASGDILKTDF